MSHSVTLTWVASPDAQTVGYNVYKGITAGGEATTPLNPTLIPATTLEFVDTNVQAGDKVDYVVTAVSASGVESVHSNEAATTVPLQPPSNLVAVAA